MILLASEVLLELGNPGLFSISLVAIGCYLFIRSRLLVLGAILLMLSLAVKPQMGVLVVMFLIMARIHWRHAIVAAAGALTILLSAGLILSHHPRSANWNSALSATISGTLKPGGVNDFRPASQEAIEFINLQTVTSVFSTDARKFNALTYAIFLALLAAWIMVFLRTNTSQEMHLISLGALSVLTLTPMYHRFYDVRLLLISIPAVTIIVEKRRFLGAFIGALTALTLVSVQYRVQLILVHHGMWQSILQNKFLFLLLLRQQNLELLILFCLYLVAILSIRFPSAEGTEVPLQHTESFVQRSA
jgi:hypothetical protein